MIDCVVKKQSITMRRAAQERKPQPDSAKGRPTATGAQNIFKLAPDGTANATLEAIPIQTMFFALAEMRKNTTKPRAKLPSANVEGSGAGCISGA